MNISNKEIFCFDGREMKDREKTLSLIYNLRFEYLLVNFKEYEKINVPHKMKLLVEITQTNDFEKLPKDIIVLSKQSELIKKAKEDGYSTAYYQIINSQDEMESAWKIGKECDYLIVELVDETNIPLELIIARLQNKDTILLKKVKNMEEAEIAFGVMESGTNGVLYDSDNVDDILEADKYMSKEEKGKIELVKGKVISIEHIGMGYRACIDTTNLLKKNEGMIIGSTSNGGLFISSETHFLPYMELRPFRVNAGAVHSYVWTPEGRTNYLTELKGGSKVLCVDTEGNTREVSVGRVKIEMRPLLKIEVEALGVRVNSIVQDDWHIRIFGYNGEVRNASTIKEGDELLAYICESGRHVGIKIDERLEER